MNDPTPSPPLTQQRRELRFLIVVVSLLCMPLCFALGWLARSWTFNRDVDAAARQIVVEAGGDVIPELGIVFGGEDLAEGKSEIDRQSAEEKERRIEFFKRLRTQMPDDAARK